MSANEMIAPTDTPPESVGFWAFAARHPTKIAVHDAEGRAVTYGALLARVNALSNLFASLGMSSGERVAILLGNQIEVHEVTLACAQSGIVFVPLNNHLEPDEMAYILRDSGTTTLIADERFATAAASAADAASINPERRFAFGVIAGFESIVAAIADEPSTFPAHRSAGAPLFYTSGTTGRPKGVLRPSMLGDLAAGLEFSLRPEHVHGWSDQTVYLAQGPLYHIGPFSNATTVLHLGGTVVHMGKWDAETCLRLIEAHAVSASNMVPTMFHRLLALPPAVRSHYDVSSLETDHVVHGAAICPVHVKQAMIEWWGPVFWETYGATEAAFTNVTSADWLRRPGTVGRARTGVELAILDDDGRTLAPGEIGTIYGKDTKRPFFGVEYFNAPDKTEASRRGDYFTVGDLGYLDDDGWLFISDRRTDLIISGGVNIYPAEIEAVITEHPSVTDAVVLGMPNDEWGHEVTAIIEVRAADDLAALELTLRRFIAERLPSFKRPRTIWFEEEMPRFSFGKVDRRRLRDQYLERHAARRGGSASL